MSARNHPDVEFAALLPEGARVVAPAHANAPMVDLSCACNLDGKPWGRPRFVVAHRFFQLSPIGVDVPERRG
jgi:hypothetical protein